MENIEIYEYLMSHKECKIVQYKGFGTIVGEDLYHVQFFYRDKSMGKRFINLADLEQIKKFRILSFDDNYDYYKELLINAYAEMLGKEKIKIRKQEQFLEILRVSKIN